MKVNLYQNYIQNFIRNIYKYKDCIEKGGLVLMSIDPKKIKIKKIYKVEFLKPLSQQTLKNLRLNEEFLKKFETVEAARIEDEIFSLFLVSSDKIKFCVRDKNIGVVNLPENISEEREQSILEEIGDFVVTNYKSDTESYKIETTCVLCIISNYDLELNFTNKTFWENLKTQLKPIGNVVLRDASFVIELNDSDNAVGFELGYENQKARSGKILELSCREQDLDKILKGL